MIHLWLKTLMAAAAGSIFVVISLGSSGFGQGQEKILYSFCSAANCTDGASPEGRLAFDSAGNLYGTTAGGGINCGECGTVFELSPRDNGTWVHSVLHNFGAGIDGSTPQAGIVLDKAGNLYGTTTIGGTFGLGTVFELIPPTQQGGSWTEAVLWSFGASGDGAGPMSDLVFDATGNLYGTTEGGGAYGGYGTVFQLVPPSSGTQWSENLLFAFGSNQLNGGVPKAGVTFGKDGNLYGATYEGGTNQGFGLGVVYKLSPSIELPWSEAVLFRFTRKTGGNSLADMTFDSLGNLYGTTTNWSGGYGSVFRLALKGGNQVRWLPFSPVGGEFPAAGILIVGETAYGTTQGGGTGEDGGTAYKIQGTTETVLYNFCSQPQCADGYTPFAALISDMEGNLYGTTANGGANLNGGVVFELPK